MREAEGTPRFSFIRMFSVKHHLKIVKITSRTRTHTIKHNPTGRRLLYIWRAPHSALESSSSLSLSPLLASCSTNPKKSSSVDDGVLHGAALSARAKKLFASAKSPIW